MRFLRFLSMTVEEPSRTVLTCPERLSEMVIESPSTAVIEPSALCESSAGGLISGSTIGAIGAGGVI